MRRVDTFDEEVEERFNFTKNVQVCRFKLSGKTDFGKNFIKF